MPETFASLLLANIVKHLLSPLGFCLLLLGCTLIFLHFNKRRAAFGSVLSALLLLWVFSTPRASQWMLGSLEKQYPVLSLHDVPNVEVALVLGGVRGAPEPPQTGSQIGKSSDRVLLASRLFKAGKVQNIWVVGGDLPWFSSETSEGQFIKELLQEWGVPSDAIRIGMQSRNTYENVLEILEMRRKTPFRSAVLITSAFHMPRAMAVFRKARLPVIAVPADIRILKRQTLPLMQWLPEAEALEETSVAFKEKLGIFVYWLRGYI